MGTVFDEVRLPTKVAFGAAFGPAFNTEITKTLGGFEQRNQNWEAARYKGSVAHEIKTQVEMDELLAFFLARRGMGKGFLYRDHIDFCSDMANYRLNTGNGEDFLPASPLLTHAPMGRLDDFADSTDHIGDNSEVDFHLLKVYASGTATPAVDDYVRQIVKPVDGGTTATRPRIYVNGSLQTEGGGNDYTLEYTTGVVTFNVALLDSETPTWDGLFDVAVRFDVDEQAITHDFFDVSNWTGIDIIELRPSDTV